MTDTTPTDTGDTDAATWDDFAVLTPELGGRIGQLLADTSDAEVAETIGTVIFEQDWDAGAGGTAESEAANRATALTFADEAVAAIAAGVISPAASGATGTPEDLAGDDGDYLASLLAEDEATGGDGETGGAEGTTDD